MVLFPFLGTGCKCANFQEEENLPCLYDTSIYPRLRTRRSYTCRSCLTYRSSRYLRGNLSIILTPDPFSTNCRFTILGVKLSETVKTLLNLLKVHLSKRNPKRRRCEGFHNSTPNPDSPLEGLIRPTITFLGVRMGKLSEQKPSRYPVGSRRY